MERAAQFLKFAAYSNLGKSSRKSREVPFRDALVGHRIDIVDGGHEGAPVNLARVVVEEEMKDYDH